MMENTQDLAGISLPARLPPFWRRNPRLWFAQFEAAVATSKCSEENKFNLVVPLLGYEDLDQIADIVLSPPATERYNQLKTRLLQAYEESEHQRLQRLLSGFDLGDASPSQLWRRMATTNQGLITEKALKMMWINLLPTPLRVALATSLEEEPQTLTSKADAMHRMLGTPPSTDLPKQPDDSATLLSRISELALEVAELKRRPQQRSDRTHSSSRDRHRRKDREQGSSQLCWYHHTFGNKARKCTQPCRHQKAGNLTLHRARRDSM